MGKEDENGEKVERVKCTRQRERGRQEKRQKSRQETGEGRGDR